MKTSRRNFIGKLLGVAGAVGLASWPYRSHAKSKSHKMVHQVYFWLKDPADPAAREKLKQGLQKLLSIKSIKSAHIGVPAATEKRDVVDHSFDFSLTMNFESVEKHQAYQEDPEHHAFIESCADLWDRVKVYDHRPV